MRYFLIPLIWLTSFLSQAQDSTIHISPSTARYFLEQDDKVGIYETRDSLQTTLIANLKQTIVLKDSMIVTYQADSVTRDLLERNLLLEISFKKVEADDLRRELRKQKIRNLLEIIGAVGLVILIL
jgi:hypothetical protein